ncbi:MAG: flagellar export chaperone FliS [Vulcanimicrobiaceae bacterium]|jgi:flagellar protein FliS
MPIANPNLRYLEASINSASPEELIVKIYDALLLFSRQAIEVMETQPRDVEGRHRLLRKAQRACALLMGSLRFEVGGDLPRNLFRLYEFWHHQLVGANMHGDPQRVRDLLPMIGELRDTWAEAVKRYRLEGTASAPPQLDALVG